MVTQNSTSVPRTSSIITGFALVGSALYAISSLQLIAPHPPLITSRRSLLDGEGDGGSNGITGKGSSAGQPLLKLLPGGGRIGDQLFMYASLLRLSHQHKMRPCIVKSFRRITIQKLFVGPYEWCDDGDAHDVDWEGGWQAERVPKLRRREGDSDLVYGLGGYMHSPSNFADYSSGLIYDALTLKEDSDAYRRAHEVLKIFDDESIIKVGVHVRRGDKVLNEQYQIADIDFFSRAMKYIRTKYNDDKRSGGGRRVQFIIMSDSIPWVQKYRKQTEVFGANDVFLVEHRFVENANPYNVFDSTATDLAIMIQCDHIVLSGGGFGFWGAFLGAHRTGGEVVVGGVQEKTMNSLEDWTNIDDMMTNQDDLPSSPDKVLAVG